MADEKKSLILDLLARNKMRKDTSDAADDLDKLGHAAEDADKKTESLGTTTEKTGKQTDKMGNSLSDTKGRISGLDKEIESIDKELKSLSASFADAGSASERADISKAIRRTQTDLKNVQKNKGVLEGLLPDPEPAAKSWISKFKSSFVGGFEGIGEAAQPGLIGALVAFAPLVGASIAGAVIGAVGVGGIAGGFLLAAKNPQVQSAAKSLGTSLSGELKEAAKPFTESALGGIGAVKSALNTINFGGIFKDLAPQSGAIIGGVTRLIRDLGGAIEDIAKNSGPVIDAIGNEIGDFGGVIASGLESLSDNGDDAAKALKDLFAIINGGTSLVFGLVNGLTEVYGVFNDLLKLGIIGAYEQISSEQTQVAGTAVDVANAMIAAAESTDTQTKASKDQAQALLGQRDALVAVNNELRAQVDPAFAVLNATDQVRDAHDAAAKAVKKYGENSEQGRAATRKLAEAALDLQGDVGKLGGSFDGKLSPSMKRTLKAAGLTKGEIAEVQAELKRAKAAADAYAGTYKATIITGYTYEVGGQDYNREAHRAQYTGKRAAGGPVARGLPYLVGENGPEIVIPDTSGRVLSAGASRGLVATAAVGGMRGSYGGGSQVRGVQVEVVGNDPKLVTLLKYLIRTGNVIESGSNG